MAKKTSWCLVFYFLLFTFSFARAEGVQWRHDYNSARKEAHEKSRPLFLDFGTDNCFWCRRLDETTFRNPAIQKLLNEQFVPIKVDAHRSPFLTEVLNVHAFPTLVIAATDGKLLHTLQGYQDAPRLNEVLQQALTASGGPEAMTRDYEDAVRAVNAADSARAVALLKRVTEDGRDRPVQIKARQLLADLEAKAAVRMGNVRPVDPAGFHAEDKSRRARELLAQAREDFRTRQFLTCFERCESITSMHADAPEAAEAGHMLKEMKANPEWMQQACDALSERLGSLYLSLADACAAKGQNQQAMGYLERVLQAAPGTRSAESAKARLAQVSAKPIK